MARYPNATGVINAREVFNQKCKDGKITVSTLHTLLDGLNRWKASKQWRAEDGKYIPALAKWLAEERWHDRPPQDGIAGLEVKRSRRGTDPMAIYDPNAND